MALSAFEDKSNAPRPDQVTEVLGRTGKAWDKLRKQLYADYEGLAEEWKYSGKAWGWSLQLKQKKRTVLYFTPCQKHFMIGLVLGEKAFKAAKDSGLPDAVIEMISSATKYAEGRAVRIEVRSIKDVGVVLRLTSIKMAN